MESELSSFQKKRKAENIVERLQLAEDLNDLDHKLGKIFDDIPIHVSETISKKEMKNLISEIKQGTNDNNKISRFLDIAQQLGFS